MVPSKSQVSAAHAIRDPSERISVRNGQRKKHGTRSEGRTKPAQNSYWNCEIQVCSIAVRIPDSRALCSWCWCWEFWPLQKIVPGNDLCRLCLCWQKDHGVPFNASAKYGNATPLLYWLQTSPQTTALRTKSLWFVLLSTVNAKEFHLAWSNRWYWWYCISSCRSYLSRCRRLCRVKGARITSDARQSRWWSVCQCKVYQRHEFWWPTQWDPRHCVDKVFAKFKDSDVVNRLLKRTARFITSCLVMGRCTALLLKPPRNCLFHSESPTLIRTSALHEFKLSFFEESWRAFGSLHRDV